MAAMEAAVAATTATEVAHPMEEQAGPFPIEKLQVREERESFGGPHASSLAPAHTGLRHPTPRCRALRRRELALSPAWGEHQPGRGSGWAGARDTAD